MPKTLKGKITHFAGTYVGKGGKDILHHANTRACGTGSEWYMDPEDNPQFIPERLTPKTPKKTLASQVHDSGVQIGVRRQRLH